MIYFGKSSYNGVQPLKHSPCWLANLQFFLFFALSMIFQNLRSKFFPLAKFALLFGSKYLYLGQKWNINNFFKKFFKNGWNYQKGVKIILFPILFVGVAFFVWTVEDTGPYKLFNIFPFFYLLPTQCDIFA